MQGILAEMGQIPEAHITWCGTACQGLSSSRGTHPQSCVNAVLDVAHNLVGPAKICGQDSETFGPVIMRNSPRLKVADQFLTCGSTTVVHYFAGPASQTPCRWTLPRPAVRPSSGYIGASNLSACIHLRYLRRTSRCLHVVASNLTSSPNCSATALKQDS